MSVCVFCAEISAGENFFASDELFVARADNFPLKAGHAEVVPKRHMQFIEELTDDELGSLMRFAKNVMSVLRNQSDSEINGFNLGINDGEAAGQTVPHLHLHVIPRRAGDVENPKGGIRNMFGPDSYSVGANE